MDGSADSTSFVHSYPNLRAEELEELGFAKKRDSFGTWTWFDNGMKEIYEPQLTFYRLWGGMFRLRVDVNFAKLFHGSNIHLPNSDEINDGLIFTGNNVKERTGKKYDAFKADTCRIHYAFNQQTENNDAKRIISHFANFTVPRMTRTVINDETVYFQNQSRGMRIYDKYAETIKVNATPELIEQSAKLIRYEYFFDGLTPVKRFAKRMHFGGSSARKMLSESSINAAIGEMKRLLGYGNLNLSNQSNIELIFRQTNDLKKAIYLSGFQDAVKYFGKEFYRNDIYKMSKTTYYKHLRECQKLGL